MGWWAGRGKTFKGAQQGTYKGYCALTLCYHWMKVVIKFGLDVNINTDRIRMYAPQIQYVISHFIEKDGTTKQVAIDTHNQLLESTKKVATSLHGINVYKKKFGVMTDMQLMQQMYNSHIMCSNEVLELEGGKYAGWKNDHIIVEERLVEDDCSKMKFRDCPERKYLVQHCFEKNSLGMNLEDFVALFLRTTKIAVK